MNTFFKPVVFPCGAQMTNTFMLAPMTNTQSNADGTLHDDEFNWLTMRAKGGFGLTMTCASHVQKIGQGFPGQLGIFSEKHSEGHKRLAKAIKDAGSLAVIQLHHAGIRSPKELLQENPVGPSPHEKTGSRALLTKEVIQLRDDFIAAAIRSKDCGYDGVEIHGAHGYILCQFLSSKYNKRTDDYGGTLENRSRLIFEIVAGIRKECGSDFLIGVRLSPERFGMQLEEVIWVCKRLISTDKIDFLDISLWDVFKEPEAEAGKGKTLLDHFAEIDYKDVRWTVAGKINSGEDVRKVLDSGVDFVSIGRAGILHHNFPLLVKENADFKPVSLPVSSGYLKSEGLSDQFITYMRRWPDFVSD